MNASAQRPTKTSVLSKAIRSKTYLSIPSVSGLHRGSVFFRTIKGFKIPKYQNTYRLEPYIYFNCEVVDKILINVMQHHLTGLKYHPQICVQICQRIAAETRDRICRMYYDRYKFIVVISIVQKLGQDVRTDFSKLWDVGRDTYSTHVIETSEFAAMGLVVGTYYE